MTATAALADPQAREHLRHADPVLAGIAARPDFRPCAWLDELGPWTAHGFLLVALDRPDVPLAGDLARRRTVERVYGLDHLPTEAEMLGIAARWRPYRSLAVSYLFASEYEG